ncbi:HlyD family type I secretion periplasmic adaptor subunit [Cohaesibacter sp. CAU 1516]|nr:HlyD family type I secretion periplasmic adaptor subunit [Cohaesibacter sp. CAU 1516]
MNMSREPIDDRVADLISFERSKRLGAFLLVAFFVGFGSWASLAPLRGAVIATGHVVKEGDTQTITHESGGVVSRILVREGQTVKKGDPLILIDDVERFAELEQIETQLTYLIVREARLVAEQTDTDFPPTDHDFAEKALTNDQFQRFVSDQKEEYSVRQRLRAKEEDIVAQQRQALLSELKGLKAEIEAQQSWRSILKEQVETRTKLLKKGAVSKLAVQETKKSFAEVDVAYQKIKGQIDSLPHRIAELDARLAQIGQTFAEQVAKDLSSIRAEKLVLQKKLAAAEKAFARVELVAPKAGIINKLHVNTVGSAVAAFQSIVEIVPEGERLLVEVELNPADIEQVAVGQPAKLVLSAFDASEVQPVNARVDFVSPDRRINQRTQVAYFVARIEVIIDETTMLPDLFPGMPVEAYMQTEERTFLQILLDPLTKSIRRSFRS